MANEILAAKYRTCPRAGGAMLTNWGPTSENPGTFGVSEDARVSTKCEENLGHLFSS